MSVKKILCNLCQKYISASNYNKHLRRHENHPESFKTREVYHLDHDDLFCKFCKKECKNKNALVQHEIRCKYNLDRINVFVEGLNLYNSHQAWNKGLTKETDERIAKGCETFNKNKLLGKHHRLFGNKNPSSRQDVRDKISKTCLNKSKNGEWHTSLAKNMHINYKGIDLHGSYELAYAQYLDKANIKWERCKDRFEYFYKDSTHYYTPDFYLVDSDEYIEIKGYATGKDYAKWKQFPKDKILKVLMKKDLILLGIDVC